MHPFFETICFAGTCRPISKCLTDFIIMYVEMIILSKRSKPQCKTNYYSHNNLLKILSKISECFYAHEYVLSLP